MQKVLIFATAPFSTQTTQDPAPERRTDVHLHDQRLKHTRTKLRASGQKLTTSGDEVQASG